MDQSYCRKQVWYHLWTHMGFWGLKIWRKLFTHLRFNNAFAHLCHQTTHILSIYILYIYERILQLCKAMLTRRRRHRRDSGVDQPDVWNSQRSNNWTIIWAITVTILVAIMTVVIVRRMRMLRARAQRLAAVTDGSRSHLVPDDDTESPPQVASGMDHVWVPFSLDFGALSDDTVVYSRGSCNGVNSVQAHGTQSHR